MLFAFGSILGGVATGVHALIGARVLQGIAAAMLTATCPAMIANSVPKARLTEILGFQSAMTYLGVALGPMGGGYLGAWFGWRSLFILNVPVALLAVGLLVTSSKQILGSGRPQLRTNALCSIWPFAVGLLLVAAIKHDWVWHLRFVPGLALAAVFLILFFTIDRRNPVTLRLGVELLHERNVWSSNVNEILHYSILYAVAFLLPTFLISLLHQRMEFVGLAIAVQPMARAVVALLAGKVSSMFGVQWTVVIGAAVAAFSLAGFCQLSEHTPTRFLLLCLGVLGVGTGLLVPSNASNLLASLPSERRGLVSGMLGTSRNLGMAIGFGAASSIYSSGVAALNAASPGGDAMPVVAYVFRVTALLAASAVLVAGVGATGKIFAFDQMPQERAS